MDTGKLNAGGNLWKCKEAICSTKCDMIENLTNAMENELV